MADVSAQEPSQDPLLNLRQAIASGGALLTSTTDAPSGSEEPNLAVATHLRYPSTDGNTLCVPLNTTTRFESSSGPLDLRSIYFAWLKKDVAIPDYISATQALTQELVESGKAGEKVQNLVFAEKLDLITWLEGASDESEYIRGLPADQAKVSGAANVAAGMQGGVAVVPSGAQGARTGRTLDPRLREIYNGERRMGDRNTILRGIRPTDFSHVHKHAEAFLSRSRKQPGRPAPSTQFSGQQILAQNRNKPGRRPEPIILLSPSASSLLKMSNIKSFLDDGIYQPPDSSAGAANILHISRMLPSIDPSKPFRFILVDSPDQFRPDYWNRVVAVFTTGQTWQFKSYKWQQPPDLFSHALGIYIGYKTELVPAAVKGWGRGVISAQLDMYNAAQGAQGRWRDREVVEFVWTAIEESMRVKGWTKEGAPAVI